MNVLSPFLPADAPALAARVDSPEMLWLWAGPLFAYPLTAEQVLGRGFPEGTPAPDRRAFKATDPGTGELVGYLELNDITPQNRSATLSLILVAASHRRQGLAGRMIREALREAFEELNLHRVDLVVFEDNPGAIACYEALGFQHEGLLRDVFWHAERFWGIRFMSMLAPEFAAHRAMPVAPSA